MDRASAGEPATGNRMDPATRAHYVTITNWGLVAGLVLFGTVHLIAYLFQIPGFSGAWMGLCADGTGLFTMSSFFLILAGGPALMYLYASGNDLEINADLRLQYSLFNGIFAIGGSYFLVFLLSLILQVLMPFPPDELMWIIMQGVLFFAIWIGIRWQCSRHFAIPMRWIPTKLQALFFIGIIGLVLVFLFFSGYLASGILILSRPG
jgi:hypothetical protein